jgi:hypothetical protein
MEPRHWLLLVAVLIIGAIAIEAYLVKGKYRPFAHKFKHQNVDPKAKPPLGTEATDLTAFDAAIGKNESLARDTGARGDNWRGHIAARSIPPVSIPDDETYAARYFDRQGVEEKEKRK